MDNIQEIIGQDVIDKVVNYKGDIRKLDKALGAYCIGQLFGWKVLYLSHTQGQLRQLEETLGMGQFADICPERTSLSYKSFGLSIVDAGTGLWRVIKDPQFRKQKPLLVNVGGLL